MLELSDILEVLHARAGRDTGSTSWAIYWKYFMLELGDILEVLHARAGRYTGSTSC